MHGIYLTKFLNSVDYCSLQTLVRKTFVWILSTETLEWKVDKLDAWGFPGAFQNQVNHCCYNEVAFESTDLNSLFEWFIWAVHSLIKTYFIYFFQNWKVLWFCANDVDFVQVLCHVNSNMNPSQPFGFYLQLRFYSIGLGNPRVHRNLRQST